MKLKLKDIQLDKGLTPRTGINNSTVEIYKNSFSELPPVDVYWIEGKDGWWLVDGWHRYEAAKNLGKEEIEANEHQGTFDVAKEFSFDSNLKHGQSLTINERKEAAKHNNESHIHKIAPGGRKGEKMTRGYKKTSEEYRDEAKTKAFASLAGYKFYMFGYWAAMWVQMNKLCRFRESNPFNRLVELARKTKG